MPRTGIGFAVKPGESPAREITPPAREAATLQFLVVGIAVMSGVFREGSGCRIFRPARAEAKPAMLPLPRTSPCSREGGIATVILKDVPLPGSSEGIT